MVEAAISARLAGADGIVGRRRELARFSDVLERMLQGHRQLLLISGDPGIGKTSYAEAIANAAEDRGALVIWGRCYEEPGAPPYWPWTQALREYLDAITRDEMSLAFGDNVREIAAILPELSDPPDERSADAHSMHESLSAGARFRMFSTVAQFLAQAAEQVPIVLVFDNLHWADAPTLSLLEFCCHELANRRLLVCGTYRDSEVTRKSPLFGTLGGLSSLAGVNRMHLSGLSESDIGRLATNLLGRELPEPILGPVCRQTDGNPLFARELVKFLIDEIADAPDGDIAVRVPDSIRETIGRRLSRLPDACTALLEIAAVFGRYFTAPELAAAADREFEEIFETLQPAIASRIVEETAAGVGSYRFTHALIRETLYEDMAALDKLKLHGKAGDTLLKLYPDCPSAVVSRIAYHYGESASLGNTEQAAAFGLRAAESAARIGAYEDAVSNYDQVIGVLDLFGDAKDERIAGAYLGKGIALKELGDVEHSTEALLTAVSRIRTPDNLELLINVAMQLAITTSHIAQTHMIPLLKAALKALPEEDSILRAQAMLTYAFAAREQIDRRELCSQIEDGLRTAGLFDDGQVLCACYHLAQMALRETLENLPQRLSLSEAHLATARATENADLVAEACHWQSLNLLEAGKVDELDALLDSFGRLSATEYGLHQYRLESCRITLALLRGNWAGLDARIGALRDLGRKTRRDDADGVYGAQMFALNRDLGHLQVLAPSVRLFIEQPASSVWQPGLMFMCSELGMLDEARQVFDKLARDDFAHLCNDEMYLTCLVFCSETCTKLDDVDRARRLLELLSPYADRTANHPTAVCYGAVAHYLGLLARTTGDTDAAAEHFERALERHREMSAWPWLARTQASFGAMLVSSSDQQRRGRGRDLLREAEALTDRLGMNSLSAEVSDGLCPERAANAPDGLTAREIEVIELLAIGRSNKDISRVLSISLNTVATHVRNILNKSGCANRTEAAAYAIRNGFGQPNRCKEE